MQPNAHSGFLQSLESVTEYSEFDSDGNGIKQFDRKRPETLVDRTLDWAAREVLQLYNDDDSTQQLAFSDLTR